MTRPSRTLGYQPGDELLTAREAAERLRIGESTFRLLVREGRIGFIPVGERKGQRFTQRHLDVYLASREVPAMKDKS